MVILFLTKALKHKMTIFKNVFVKCARKVNSLRTKMDETSGEKHSKLETARLMNTKGATQIE